jgi:hypothetical protein
MAVEPHPVFSSSLETEEKRRYPRALVSVPVSIRMLMPGGVRSARGVTLDIGAGGIGALVASEFRIGQIVEIDAELGCGCMTTVAIVRHHSGTRTGFEFLGLRREERESLTNLVAGIGASSHFGSA